MQSTQTKDEEIESEPYPVSEFNTIKAEDDSLFWKATINKLGSIALTYIVAYVITGKIAQALMLVGHTLTFSWNLLLERCWGRRMK
jgi:hypothetical protein